MNWGLLGAIYAMFHATHGIADYWFQSDWQAQNKSKNWLALLNHVTFYGLSFMWVGYGLAYTGHISWEKAAALPFVIAVPHGWMDRRKFLMWFVAKTKGWLPEHTLGLTPAAVAVRTHVIIHMDQKFHYLCLLLTAFWLAWGST